MLFVSVIPSCHVTPSPFLRSVCTHGRRATVMVMVTMLLLFITQLHWSTMSLPQLTMLLSTTLPLTMLLQLTMVSIMLNQFTMLPHTAQPQPPTPPPHYSMVPVPPRSHPSSTLLSTDSTQRWENKIWTLLSIIHSYFVKSVHLEQTISPPILNTLVTINCNNNYLLWSINSSRMILCEKWMRGSTGWWEWSEQYQPIRRQYCAH